MGFSFRKRKKILPGVTLNISTKSIGVRVGGKNAGVSVNSKRGARASASIPGTGVSVSQQLSGRSSKSTEDVDQLVQQPRASDGVIGAVIMLPLASLGFFVCLILGLIMLFGPYYYVGIAILLMSALSGLYAWRAFRRLFLT